MILDFNVLLVVCVAQAIFLSFLPVELARNSGPKAVKLASIVATVISFVVGVVLSPANISLFAALGFAVPTMILSWLYSEKIVAVGIRKQIELAPQVVSFGLRNFDRFSDGSVISSSALHIALEEGTIAEDDYEIVTHMTRRMSDIGHVIDTFVSTAGGMHGVAAIAIYGISREDLRSYPARLKERYAGWFAA